MGSVFKRVRKTIKKVTKPISKVTKGIAKGIAKVAKSVMKGVAKLNKKLGPIGMIAMSIAMPYAMKGLGAGFTKLQAANATNPFGTFLESVKTVSTNFRTGWNGFKEGFGNIVKGPFESVSNTIKKTFDSMGKGNNIFKRISDGAKTLYQKAKEFTPKFRQGNIGTIEVGGQQMSSQQAYEMVQKGMIDASQLGKQTLGQGQGLFTSAGNQYDKLISDVVNSTYSEKIKMLDVNGTRHFNDLVRVAKDAGTYTHDGDIFNYMTNGKGTTAQYLDFTDDVIGYSTDLSKTGDYVLGTARDRVTPGGVYNFTGNDTYGKSLQPNKFKNVLKNKTSKKLITAMGDTLLKKSDMPEIPEFDLISTAGATSNDGNYSALTSSAVVQGSTGTDAFKKVYGDEAWQKLKSTVNHMGYKGSEYGI